MRKKRIQSAERKSHRTTSSIKAARSVNHVKTKFVGVSLSGGKADKSAVAIIEYYPEQQRIFLAQLVDKIKSEETESADTKIHNIIESQSSDLESVVFNVPLSFPKCVRCDLPCPGHEVCNEPEIRWMRDLEANRDKKKPRKYFTPYTQRAVESFLMQHLDEKFDIQDALGANLAPVTARAHYLSRRWSFPVFETMTKIAVWRIGLNYKITRAPLKRWWNSVGGDEARKVILQNLSERANIFIYQQDLRAMVENPHAFEALICAFVALLKYQGRVEPCPSDFPTDEGWIEIPYFGSYSK